jgi:hypothetical protein
MRVWRTVLLCCVLTAACTPNDQAKIPGAASKPPPDVAMALSGIWHLYAEPNPFVDPPPNEHERGDLPNERLEINKDGSFRLLSWAPVQTETQAKATEGAWQYDGERVILTPTHVRGLDKDQMRQRIISSAGNDPGTADLLIALSYGDIVLTPLNNASALRREATASNLPSQSTPRWLFVFEKQQFTN